MMVGKSGPGASHDEIRNTIRKAAKRNSRKRANSAKVRSSSVKVRASSTKVRSSSVKVRASSARVRASYRGEIASNLREGVIGETFGLAQSQVGEAKENAGLGNVELDGKFTKNYRSESMEFSDNSSSPGREGRKPILHIDDERSVSRYFLWSFIVILAFFLGTGIGNRGDGSLVDGAINQIISNSPQKIERSILERAAIEGALRASGDEWANYFPVSTLDELSRVTSNVMTGAGISITKSRSGALQIADIQSGSPAERAGIRVGDLVLSVNGKNVQGQPATTVGAMIRAESGKLIKLAVSRGTEILDFALRSEPVEFSTVDGYQISNGVTYLAISAFASGTSLEVGKYLSEFDSSKGLVIDLRDNPGGLLDEAVQVAQKFINRGVIVSYKVNGEEKVFSAKNDRPVNSPVVLLVNRGTSSSAEILAAAFQDRNRGVVIGERTYGKGSVQEFVTLKDGSQLELTVALYLTPAGRTIEEVGIVPDLEVSDSELAIKALQILGGLAELSTQKQG